MQYAYLKKAGLIKIIMEFPAGIYYLGDPLNFLKREYLDAWSELEYPEGYYSGFIAFYTASGAGLFTDNKGAVYDSMTGTIGLVPESIAKTGRNLEVYGRRINTEGRSLKISESDGTITVKIGGRVVYEIETLLLDDAESALLESEDNE